MKTTDNFKTHAPCCANCKHSFFYNHGKVYASMGATYGEDTYNFVVCYCNVEKKCPFKTQKEFTAYGKGNFDPNSPIAKWLNFGDKNDFTSTKRYVGTGGGVCDKWEPLEEEEAVHE